MDLEVENKRLRKMLEELMDRKTNPPLYIVDPTKFEGPVGYLVTMSSGKTLIYKNKTRAQHRGSTVQTLYALKQG